MVWTAGLNAKNLCGVKMASPDGKNATLSFSAKHDLAILIKNIENQVTHFQYVGKSGRLESEGQAVEVVPVEPEATVYVAEGIIRGCVIKAEKRNGKRILYVEELFYTGKNGPRIETEIIELE